jgi:ribosomal protein S18 acetylase RimI-like enzyme
VLQKADPKQAALHLRKLTAADLPFADTVRELAGWNQTLLDWQRFLASEPEGCFLAEWNGAPAGTATTTIYSPDLAWIGMVLVHPDYRRRGIGRALLQHCIAYLRTCAIRCIKLDATPAGKLVYDGLGFSSEWTLKRWAGRTPTGNAGLPEPGLRPWQDGDLALLEGLEEAAFGVSRRTLVSALASQSKVALVLETGPGRINGFGFARPGSKALYLGPVVADSPNAGLVLLRALIARTPGQPTFWDIPDLNEPAVSLAENLGFTVQRPLIRMFLGNNAVPGDPSRQFALAGPEVG